MNDTLQVFMAAGSVAVGISWLHVGEVGALLLQVEHDSIKFHPRLVTLGLVNERRSNMAGTRSKNPTNKHEPVRITSRKQTACFVIFQCRVRRRDPEACRSTSVCHFINVSALVKLRNRVSVRLRATSFFLPLLNYHPRWRGPGQSCCSSDTHIIKASSSRAVRRLTGLM